MKRVLVTGGAGFVGASLVRALLESGHELRILEDFSTGRLEYLEELRGDIDVREGTITDPDEICDAMAGVGAVVHLAAISGVQPSVVNPRRDFETNVLGTFNVFEAARLAGTRHVTFASSGAVLAGATPPLHEGQVPHPLAPYGSSKLFGEALARAFESVYEIVGLVFRFSNVYGPFCSHKQSAVPVLLDHATRGAPLPIDGDGAQTRDFVFVDDIVRAILLGISAEMGGLYHLGTGVETSIRDLAAMVARTVDIPLDLEWRPGRRGDAARNFSDIRRVHGDLGWEPQVSLEEGLQATARWLAKDVVRASRTATDDVR